MVTLDKAVDGRKTYIVAGLMLVAAIAIVILHAMGHGEGMPTIDTATQLFWAALALLGVRSAMRKLELTNRRET